MYGSSFMCVTPRPRASISAPMDADVSPLPIDETTPPVTNTNFVRRSAEDISEDFRIINRAPLHAHRTKRARSPQETPHLFDRWGLGPTDVEMFRETSAEAENAQNVPTTPRPTPSRPAT